MASNQQNRIILNAEILAYLIDDLHFDYDNGTFEWFDATKLEILEPQEFLNKIYYIYHNNPEYPNSIWRKIGLKVSLEFNISKDAFNPDEHDEIIFSDGVIIKEIIENR